MTKELKTVKDWLNENTKGLKDFSKTDLIFSYWDISELFKKEAIKWAKDPNKLRRNWFKNFLEFHNITEEDLK